VRCNAHPFTVIGQEFSHFAEKSKGAASSKAMPVAC
jgi:hypothetical protein